MEWVVIGGLLAIALLATAAGYDESTGELPPTI